MKNIVVIGGGPGGYPAALKAASLGAKVTLVEKNKVGGVCLNCGCIPSKSLLDAAHRLHTVQTISSLCADGAQEAADRLFALRDWGKIQARQQAATRKLTQGIGFLLKKAGVDVLTGEASFKNVHTVSVRLPSGEEQKLEADGVILAAGSEAFFPPPFDKIKDKIYDNSTIFAIPSLPKTLTIVGGGVIGCEFADLMSALGVAVSVVEMQPRILPLEDEGAARALAQALAKRGVKFYTGLSAQAAAEENGVFTLTLSDGRKITSDAVLAAIGRSVDLTALKMENIGVEWTRRGVQVNPETLQLKDNIYAVGDVNGLFQLAHAASRQGEVAASNLCGVPAVYHNNAVPRAIYTTPEIASAGLTRQQAEAQGLTVKSHKAFLLANGRAVAQDQTEGYYELLSDAQTGRLVGAVFAGANATELIHVVSVALAAQMTAEQLKEVIFAHPTFAESIGEALHR
ncbi:dihydrolipoyl dehydrogenase [Candidatus Avelusimicrobium alvi]|uniref:dihydrolipoyl dehydrogenase n=1 Tax=Candidatus Avelusimicrobium alvi TaxID=3416221 RepID=UPI003D0DEFA4